MPHGSFYCIACKRAFEALGPSAQMVLTHRCPQCGDAMALRGLTGGCFLQEEFSGPEGFNPNQFAALIPQ